MQSLISLFGFILTAGVFSLKPSLTLWTGLDPSGKVSASFGQCWCVEWVPDNGHTKIAAGFANGKCISFLLICCHRFVRFKMVINKWVHAGVEVDIVLRLPRLYTPQGSEKD